MQQLPPAQHPALRQLQPPQRAAAAVSPPPPLPLPPPWLSALTLLAVAFTNNSLVGLLFLLAFLAWGSHCLPASVRASAAAAAAQPTVAPELQRLAVASSRSLWAAVSGGWMDARC